MKTLFPLKPPLWFLLAINAQALPAMLLSLVPNCAMRLRGRSAPISNLTQRTTTVVLLVCLYSRDWINAF